jgi:hypothetical protein
MKFWKSNKTQRNTKELLKEVNNSKSEELELLLQQIQFRNWIKSKEKYGPINCKNYNHQ